MNSEKLHRIETVKTNKIKKHVLKYYYVNLYTIHFNDILNTAVWMFTVHEGDNRCRDGHEGGKHYN